MKWGSGWGKKLPSDLSANLPSLQQLRQKVDSGLKQMNDSMKEAAETVKEVVGKEGNTSSGIGEKGGGGSGSSLFATMKGVFDIDALQSAMSEGQIVLTKPGTHFTGADLTYVTSRIILMGFPDKAQGRQGQRPFLSLQEVANFLNKRHGSKYAVWNLSEKSYDSSRFQGDVMEFSFPGYPAVPLDATFKICMSIESWLREDPENVAVVHCMTGRGRSACLVASFLHFVGSTKSTLHALRYVCKVRKSHVEQAVVPTQVRYAELVHRLLQDQSYPKFAALKLTQITMNGIPDLVGTQDLHGCRPVLDVYKDGKRLFTSASIEGAPADLVPSGADEKVVLDCNCSVEGDILIRVRHLEADGKSTSIFRAGFHTGYIDPSKTLVWRKNDLDGASFDPRIFDDTFVQVDFKLEGTVADQNDPVKLNFWKQVVKRHQDVVRKRAESPAAESPGAKDETLAFSISDDLNLDEMSSPSSQPSEGGRREARVNSNDDLFHALSALPSATTSAEVASSEVLGEEATAKPPVPPEENATRTPSPKDGESSDDSFDDFDELTELDAVLGDETANDSSGAAISSALADDPDLAELEEYLKDM